MVISRPYLKPLNENKRKEEHFNFYILDNLINNISKKFEALGQNASDFFHFVSSFVSKVKQNCLIFTSLS